MLKDSNIDPPLTKAHESLFGQDDFPNSANRATATTNIGAKNSVNFTGGIPNTLFMSVSPQAPPPAKTPRSSHKIVTPLRKQSSSFLVASLESLFSDSQGVTDQIAKIAASNPGSSFKSPASNLALSLASLSTFQPLDSLSDPNLLQSHVQNSFISLESCNRSEYSATSMKNSLYSTPIRSKQSKSHDFSELPSQQRLKARRSSILAHDDEDLSLLPSFVDNSTLLSDLSHFQDNEDNANVIHDETNAKLSMSNEGDEYNYFDNDQMEISPMKLSSKRSINSSTSRTFALPSTSEYRDGSKPPFSYASLIAQAIISNPKQRLALCNIYTWIMDTYPFYKIQTCGWQNSIRHNLSLNKCFKKIPRDDDEPGKGAYWTVDLDEMDDFEDGMFKRRRSSGGIGNCSASNSNSACTSVMNSPSTNNAFLNGTGWSPLIANTPNKMNFINTTEFNTPKNNASNTSVKNCSVPMTPLSMSLQNHKDISTAILTPKVANCTNRSPYTCLAGGKSSSSKTDQTSSDDKTKTATFWSYPNLSLSQMGLDSEPPLPETENNNYSVYNFSDQNVLPELFQGHQVNTSDTTMSKDQFTRMSPLSWLLSVSSQDSSLGLFDQSQQLLSEYLSLNM